MSQTFTDTFLNTERKKVDQLRRKSADQIQPKSRMLVAAVCPEPTAATRDCWKDSHCEQTTRPDNSNVRPNPAAPGW